MLSDKALKEISQIFIGDDDNCYCRKGGAELVSFFNSYFDDTDEYKPGFPSRWYYVCDKLKIMNYYNNLESFFSIILKRDYLISESKISEVEAAEKQTENIAKFNKVLSPEGYCLTHRNNEIHLVKKDDDLIQIGSGGFADVYKQISTGLIVKKIKDEFLADKGIRSRFKREYDITDSLKELSGIIKVVSFDEGTCSYTMEEADSTLEKYILENRCSESEKEQIIRSILTIMANVHKKDIIHRDLSPNNIFMINGNIVIADFGLGKDLNVITSHQTMYTKSVGQYFYCAPEQFMLLREADKRSDVYSLGRIMNFIMTGNPNDSHHVYRSVSEKSTSDSSYRYGDSSQLLYFFEKSVEYHHNDQNKERIINKINAKQYDEDIENYIYDLDSEELSKHLLKNRIGFETALLRFMSSSDEQACHIIQSIDQSFRNVCKNSFPANDAFSKFAYKVLYDKYSYPVKEIAATILRYVAWDVNRFSAQDLVEKLIKDGIEPLLEDIIKS